MDRMLFTLVMFVSESFAAGGYYKLGTPADRVAPIERIGVSNEPIPTIVGPKWLLQFTPVAYPRPNLLRTNLPSLVDNSWHLVGEIDLLLINEDYSMFISLASKGRSEKFC